MRNQVICLQQCKPVLKLQFTWLQLGSEAGLLLKYQVQHRHLRSPSRHHNGE